MANGAESTGGFTTQTGRSVIVTPSGQIVGSARLPGGSRGASARRRLLEQQAEEARRKADLERAERLKLEAEAKAREEVERRKQEIEQLKKNLLIEGADREQRRLRQASTGQRILETVVIRRRTGDRVVQRKNLDTGEVRTRVFTRKDGSLSEDSGIQEFVQPKKEEVKMVSQTPTIDKGVVRNKNSKLFEVVDVLSGGALTNRKLKKRQQALNNRIDRFNKEYGDKELSQKQFTQAKKEAQSIEEEQTRLDLEKNSLFDSGRRIFGRLVFGASEELSPKQAAKQRKEALPKLNKELKSLKKRLQNATGINKKRLELLIKATKEDINRVNEGRGISIKAGDFPIIPASSIPSGVTKIRFFGRQTSTKNGIKTDIIFKTSRGEIGIAKGVQVNQGPEEVSITLGRSGKQFVRLPSGKKSIRGVKSFVSVEKSKGVRGGLQVVDTVGIKKGKQTVGQFQVFKKSIETILQRSFGRVASVKGKRFISKTGKAKKRIGVQDFFSISNVLTKKDLSLIIGKTITRERAKAVFIGIIKDGKGLDLYSKLGKATQLQYKRALNKVISSASAAVAKTSKITPVTKALSVATVANVMVRTAKGLPVTTSTVTKSSTKTKATSIKARSTQQKTKQVSKVSSKSKQRQATTQKVSQRTKQKQAAATKTTTRQGAAQKVSQKQAVGQKSRVRTLQKQKQAQRSRVTARSVITPIKTPKIPFLTLKKKKFKKVTGSKGGSIGYGVEILRDRKLRKVRVAPLSLSSALDVLAYKLDTTLSRFGRIIAVGRFEELGKLRKELKGYFTSNKKKFRKFRLRRGKKVPLISAYIENKRYALDKGREVRSIQAARKKKTFKKKRVVNKRSQKKNLPKKRRIKKRILRKNPLRKKTMKRVVKRRVVRKKATRKKRKK